MGYIKNSIALHAPIDFVFEVTNQIEDWKDLFSEYAESTVLERGGNWIRFRLTTHPNEEGKTYSWQSRRFIDKDTYQATAEREDPKFPFASMKIKWTYEPSPEGTLMTWVQEFTMDPAAGMSEQQMENYLNRTTKSQQIVIKQRLEARYAAVRRAALRQGQAFNTSSELVIARLKPGMEDQISKAFAESDATDLPWLAGLTRRSIWVLGDVYVHCVESERPMRDVIANFREHPLYMEVKSKVDQCVEPLATHLIPSLAREIYRWDAESHCEPPKE